MRTLFLLITVTVFFNIANAGNWPGHSIVGNGRFCAVYSDDTQLTSKDGNRGVRHFYFNDFTADYIKSASFDIMTKSMMVQSEKVVPYMTDFFTPAADHYRGKSLAFNSSVRAANSGLIMRFEPRQSDLYPILKIEFNDTLTGNSIRHLVEISTGDKGDAFAQWNNGVRIRIISTVPYTTVKKTNSLLELHFKTNEAFEVMLRPELNGKDNNKFTRLKPVKINTAWTEAGKKWNNWIKQGSVPFTGSRDEKEQEYKEYYCRNLYAAYSSILNGQVPADVTGQFLTNGMPQLYPRDAMMTARNFLQCGYPEVAADIIRFWGRKDIQHKTPGEFFARYDAYTTATDAGSGARYDEPEWDASGYFIILNYEYKQLTGNWLIPPEELFQFANFIVSAIDSTGLLYEGGIVEWTGYLPATNMICAAGLFKAIEIANQENQTVLAEKYKSGYNTIKTSLPELFDKKRQLYVARRYHTVKTDDNFSISDKKGELIDLWDVTSVFGILWGYPDHPMMRQTYKYVKENLNDNGGVRYFEATDNAWLEAYGSDLFFFATAAWAKYAILQKDRKFAQKNLDWIIAQSNIYGLMPERVLSDYSNISEASPLTWCCSEFAAAIKDFASE